jgi:S1-C subfamily serine protease
MAQICSRQTRRYLRRGALVTRRVPRASRAAAVAAAALAFVAAALSLLAAGCDDEEESAGTTREVTTTRVEVVEGIGSGDGDFNPAEIYKRLAPGVVTIISIFEGGTSLFEDEGEGGQGSGFVLDEKGYIVTNAHVVTTEADATGESSERADEVFVEFADGNRVPAEIVGHDPNVDVALLKVDPEGLRLTPLGLGTTDTIAVGEPVAAIGSPFGEQQSLTVGVVSALNRNIQSLTQFQIGNAIQTDAPINPGNSGGPLLDAEGGVIGINAQIRSRSGGGEGVGFAVPVDAVRRSVRELRDKGRVDYGYLGVSTLLIWPQLAERLDLDARGGALVQEVEDGSPAEEAGIEPGDNEISFQGHPDIATGGDVIVAVNGRRLTRRDDLADVISSMSTGDRVKLTLLRDGERRTVQVTLGRRPPDSGE